MSPQLVVSLVGLGVVLAGILVSLGRVLQRQDTAEAAAKEAATKTAADAKAAADAIAALKERNHELERDIQAAAARIDGLGADHQRGAEKLTELRGQFAEAIRSLTSLREDIVGRLARIESYVEHHSTPPPTPQPGSGFGPPRRPTLPGDPR